RQSVAHRRSLSDFKRAILPPDKLCHLVLRHLLRKDARGTHDLLCVRVAILRLYRARRSVLHRGHLRHLRATDPANGTVRARLIPRALISWSGGKDSAWALRLARDAGIEPAALITSFNQSTNEIPIHNVPMSWIERHSSLLGIPLR